MKNVYQVLYPLTTESFYTNFRAKGFGFCSGVGRIGSILMGVVLVPLDEWSRTGAYICLWLTCWAAGFIAWSQLEETKGKSLDCAKEGTLLNDNDK
jgi:hypothetical protein